MKSLIGMIATAVVCAAGADGPSPAVSEKVLANHTPEHVASVWRGLMWRSMNLDPENAAQHDPAIASEYAEVCTEWQGRFVPPMNAMREYLRDAMPDDRWEGVTGSDLGTAQGDIDIARRMLAGIGPTPAVHYAAAFDPRFDANPLAEMEQGVTRAFPRDGSGAADGLSFVVTAPLSWLPGHARGDGTIMRLVSEAGAGLASLTIKVVPLAQDEDVPSPAALRQRALDSVVYPNRELVRDTDAQAFGEHGSACVFYDRDESRYGMTRSINKHAQFVFERRVVRFEFAVLDRARRTDDLLAMDILESEFSRLEPLFDEIVTRASAAPER